MIHQKQLENVEFFKYLGSILTNDGRCTGEIKSRIAMAKAAFNKRRTLFSSTLDLESRKKLVKCYIWSIALCGAETGTLLAADQNHLESSEMWCWRRMEKISWTDRVRKEEVLLRVKEQRNILHEISKQKAKWIGHILRRNCLLQRVIEVKIKGGIEVTGRRGRKRRKLLDDLKERRGYSYLTEEAVDRTVWRARFGRGFGPVVRHTPELKKKKMYHEGRLFGKYIECRNMSFGRTLAQTNKLLMLDGRSDLTSKCCANCKRLATSRMK